MYDIISSLLKYIFVTVIYLFIIAIIRMIYLDIRSMKKHMSPDRPKASYLKLMSCSASELSVEEMYVLGDRMTIGRDSDNDIAVADPFLTGRHAMLTKEDKGYLLKDLESTNGTFVNGEQLNDKPVWLKAGDEIRMGQLEFQYVEGAEVKP